MRRLAPRRLDAALADLTAGLAPATSLASVQARWPDAVGPTIAAEATPVSEREGVVTIACRSAVWAQELELLGPDLVARLNELLGVPSGAPRVRGLRAVVGRPPGR
jgi:predicted nucleic acid-binding Zn ribbon protein